MIPGLGGMAGFVTQAAGGWSPADIVTAGWWDLSDISSLFQDTAASTPVTGATDPIKRINDKSGNSRNLLGASDTVRPLYQTSDFQRANFDGTDDKLTATFSTTGMTSMSLWMALRVTSTQLTLPFSGTTYFAGAMQSGSGTAADAAVGTPSYYKNGSVLTATRGALYTAFVGAGAAVIEIRNLNWASAGAISFGNYGSGFIFGGDIAEIVLMTTTVAVANRTDIAAYMASQVGL